jgi:hypothetical protein
MEGGSHAAGVRRDTGVCSQRLQTQCGRLYDEKTGGIREVGTIRAGWAAEAASMVAANG